MVTEVPNKLNAMIFAAGLGTRLYPITSNMPKALVTVQGKPLIWYALQNVIKSGATHIVVNVHHFPNQIRDYLKTLRLDGITIAISDESDELLDTGGGLLKAAPLFMKDCPILIHNADVLTNCDLQQLVDYHNTHKPLATLMVQQRATNRYLLFDDHQRLRGWRNTQTGEEKLTSNQSPGLHQFAFNGIHMVDYSILNLLGPMRKFSITNGYLDLAKQESILGWHQWQGHWFDVGTVEKLETAEINYTIDTSQ